MTGEIEKDDRVLVIRRIHAHYALDAEGADPEVVERVHAFHASKCPVARSIEKAIEVTTSYELRGLRS